MRLSLPASAAALVFSALPMARAESVSPGGAVARLASGDLDEEEREEMVAALVEAGAVSPVIGHFGGRRVSADVAEPLMDALGRIGTAEAVAALRKLTFSSRFVVSDVADWRRLRLTLRRGAGESGPEAIRYVWEKLSPDVQEALAATDELTGVTRGRVVRTLNAILGMRDFHKSYLNANLKLNDEARRLLKQHVEFYEYVPGSSLDRIGVERLNRYLMDTSLKGAASPLDAIDIYHYTADVASLAVEALAGVELEAAKQIMFTIQPVPLKAQIEQIEAVAKMPGFDASALIAEYLLAKQSAAVVNARKALVRRFDEDPSAAVGIMLDVIMRLGYTGETDVPEENASGVVAVCAALPEEDARTLLVACMRLDYENLRMAVLGALAEKPALADSENMVRSMSDLAQASDDVERAKAILAVIKSGRIASALEIATYYLEHPDLEVQSLAGNVLRSVSGRNIRDPREWRAALEADPDLPYAIEEEPEYAAEATVTETVAPKEEKGSSVSSYVFIGLGFAAIFLVIYLTRASGSKIE
jgi:hypothetical protein